MWNQEIYQKAMKFSAEAHADQQVPGSRANYLLHISNVVMEVLGAYVVRPCFNVDLALQVAALHDTIEDSNISTEVIETIFGMEVRAGVSALTKSDTLSKAEKMADSIYRIKEQPVEIALVKLSDRITNMQEPPLHWSKEKRVSYADEAEYILSELGFANNYLAERLRNKINYYRQNYIQ